MKWAPHTLGWIVLFLGAMFSALTAYALNRYQHAVLQQRVVALTESAEVMVRKRFDLYQYGLRGLRGAIVATGASRFNRAAFDTYMASRDHTVEFPGARGFGVIRRISRAEELTFAANARADGAPDFSIRQLAPHDGERFVIQYLWPREGNQGATGLDIASEANRRHAALQASRSNMTRLTSPITLVQAYGLVRRGFLVMLPIYKPDLPLQTQENREQATFGWAYAALVADEVLEGVQASLQEVSFTLTDSEESAPFYESGLEELDESTTVRAERKIQIHGRTWLIRTASLPAMIQVTGLPSPWWVLGLGLPLSAFAALIVSDRRRRLISVSVSQTGEMSDWRTFTRTAWVRSLMLSYLGATVVLMGIGLAYQWQQHMRAAGDSLRESVARVSALWARNEADHRNAAAFLASTSSSLELVHAMSTLPRPDSLRSIEAIRTDVANTFKAFLLSSPAVYQVRLMGVADAGLELVRIERHGDQLRVLSGSQLQAKGGERYMLAARDLSPGQTWVSALTLNREYGEVVQPALPTLRFAAPLFTEQNELFGIVVLNVDARSLLTSSAGLAPPDGGIYMTRGSGDFVLHPDSSLVFGEDYGRPHLWNEVFTPTAIPLGTDPTGLSAWQTTQGQVLAAIENLLPNGLPRGETLSIAAGVPLLAVLSRFWQPLILPFIGLLALGMMGSLGLYLSWSRLARAEVLAREQAQMEQQRQERTLFQGILESAPEAMLVVDANGTILLANARLEQMFGYGADALLGASIERLLPETLAASHRAHVMDFARTPHARLMGGGQPFHACRENGEEFPVEVSLGPVRHAGQLLVVASVRDLTRQREFEDLLRDARDQAERANQAKSAFLANMSHEIRTPLNAVIGLTGLLSGDELNEQQRGYVQKIQLSGRALLGIVNDVLDLAKIEAHEMSLEERPCRLSELLERMENVFGTQAEAKGLVFVLEEDPELPHWVIADCNRLGQVLTNLLGNALKFTASGHIRLSARMLQADDADSANRTVSVQFAVEDTGIGIAPDAQENLFKPFSQADDSTARRFGGTGLGLSIVKHMIGLMHGELGVSSASGKGSRFWATLSFRLPEDDQIPSEEDVVDPVQVLLAEDDVSERDRLVTMMRALGWHPVMAGTGVELMDTLRKRVTDGRRPFDVLIVDWQMPDMDGLTALSTLARELGRDALPGVLLISSLESSQIKALDTDCLTDQILRKPVNASQLFNAVNDIVTSRTGKNMRVLQATRTEAGAVPWLAGVRILVGDDNDMNLEVVTAILSRSGAQVTAVSNGQAVLAALNDQHGGFDVVLMDVQMPGMDGLETTRRIRRDPALPQLPIIALTAGALLEEKRRALDAGMDDFLTKPVEPTQLINRVRAAVERYRGERLPIDPAARAIDKGEKTWPEIPGIDTVAAAKLLGGDLDLFFNTLTRVLTQQATIPLPPADETGERAWRAALAADMHKLRGSAGLIGATHLHQLAGAAETALRTTDRDPAQALAALRTEFSALREASESALIAWREQAQHVLETTVDQRLDAAALAELLDLLARQDLDALERAKSLAPSLRGSLGPDNYARFCTVMQELDFTQAVALLQALLSPHTASGDRL